MNAECRIIFQCSIMRSDERRVSGSTGVHAALLAPQGAVRAVGSTRRRQSPRQRQYGRSRRPRSAARRSTRRRLYHSSGGTCVFKKTATSCQRRTAKALKRFLKALLFAPPCCPSLISSKINALIQEKTKRKNYILSHVVIFFWKYCTFNAR